MVRILLKNGAKVNNYSCADKMPLYFAIREGNIEIVKLLLEKGADVNAKGNNDRTSLHYADRRNYIELIRLFINKGANIDLLSMIRNPELYILNGKIKFINNKLKNNLYQLGINNQLFLILRYYLQYVMKTMKKLVYYLKY